MKATDTLGYLLIGMGAAMTITILVLTAFAVR
jgi:hypothetical protein